MANLPVYSARDVDVSFLSNALDGLAPDSSVTFQRNSDITESEVGADGSVAISILPDRTGTCTISLQQSSPGNIFLSGILAVQEAENNLAKGPITITDPSGSVVASLRGCHIMTSPEVSLGSTASGSTRDWVFFCEEMKFLSVPEGASETAIDVVKAADAVATARSLESFVAGLLEQ